MIGAAWIARLAAIYLLVGSVACAASKLYVTNSGGDDITVIDRDGSALKAVGDIKVGKLVHGICAPASTDRLFATVESDKSLKVIDTKSDRIIDVIQLTGEPNQCASTPDGHYVAVPEYTQDRIEIADMPRKRIAAVLGIPHPHNCFNALSDSEMFCSSVDMHDVYRIDLKTMTYSAEIGLPGEPRPFVVARDGLRLYAQLSGLHGFVIAGVSEHKTVRRIELPPAPISTCVAEAGPWTPSHGLALAARDKELWVTSLADGRVYDYDVATMRILAEIAVGRCPSWVAASADGRYVAVSNSSSDDVSIIDSGRHQEIERVKVGRVPKRLLFIDVK
jgi:YVTN family beta-propeller protein